MEFAPAINGVIDNHIGTQTPIVLDGDYLLSEMGAWQEEVKSVFLYEPEEKQIIEIFARREPDEGEQVGKARVSWLFGQWLKEECQKLGMGWV